MATARPMPESPPVTSALRPSRRPLPRYDVSPWSGTGSMGRVRPGGSCCCAGKPAPSVMGFLLVRWGPRSRAGRLATTRELRLVRAGPGDRAHGGERTRDRRLRRRADAAGLAQRAHHLGRGLLDGGAGPAGGLREELAGRDVVDAVDRHEHALGLLDGGLADERARHRALRLALERLLVARAHVHDVARDLDDAAARVAAALPGDDDGTGLAVPVDDAVRAREGAAGADRVRRGAHHAGAVVGVLAGAERVEARHDVARLPAVHGVHLVRPPPGPGGQLDPVLT